jgi:hypothetical protein
MIGAVFYGEQANLVKISKYFLFYIIEEALVRGQADGTEIKARAGRIVQRCHAAWTYFR